MTVGNTTGENVVLNSDTLARVDVMQTGARALMYVAFGASVLLMVVITTSQPSDPLPILAGALHCLNLAATMAVAVGALHGHRAILAAVNRTQRQMARYDTQIEERLQRLDRQICRLREVESRILSAAAGDDEVTIRRLGGHN